MQSNANIEKFFQSKVLGHPAGLFVLFFTEMWERFSFYGMRVLLIQFLIMSFVGTNPGWEWTSENAGALFGTYASLLYLTPILGGIIADKLLGYRGAVILGAFIMMLGHFCMALETVWSLYVGLGLLVVGTGFFKPNITSIISEMYKDLPKKKDGAYTIFYMGVNAGAFFGMLLCGYLGEKIGWSYGFGLAGIFMFFGAVQFWFAKKLFGKIGDKPAKETRAEKAAKVLDYIPNKFTVADRLLIALTAIVGFVFLINDPLSKIALINIMPVGFGEQTYTIVLGILSGITIIFLVLLALTFRKGINQKLLRARLFTTLVFSLGMLGLWIACHHPALNEDGTPYVYNGPLMILVFAGLIPFLYLAISRILRYEQVVRYRMFAVIIFAFFTVFFFLSFEQGATSLVIFAGDFTDRTLDGNSAIIFNIINLLLTLGPLLIITWVLYRLFRETWAEIKWSNIMLGLSFLGVWIIAIWMINRDMNTIEFNFTHQQIQTPDINKKTGEQTKDPKTGELVFLYTDVVDSTVMLPTDIVVTDTATFIVMNDVKPEPDLLLSCENGNYILLEEKNQKLLEEQSTKLNRGSVVIRGKLIGPKSGAVEITTSWFSILNSFFIIAFASFFSKWWESKYNPSAAMKYAIGLAIMGVGFGVLAYGSIPIGDGTHDIRVSMVWLILAYFFHTLGELCVSPVGLSMVSKLVPGRMIGFMFGMWYLAIAIGNKLAASLGGSIEGVVADYDMSTFYLIFTIVPVGAAVIIMFLNPVMKKLMKGAE